MGHLGYGYLGSLQSIVQSFRDSTDVQQGSRSIAVQSCVCRNVLQGLLVKSHSICGTSAGGRDSRGRCVAESLLCCPRPFGILHRDLDLPACLRCLNAAFPAILMLSTRVCIDDRCSEPIAQGLMQALSLYPVPSSSSTRRNMNTMWERLMPRPHPTQPTPTMRWHDDRSGTDIWSAWHDHSTNRSQSRSCHVSDLSQIKLPFEALSRSGQESNFQPTSTMGPDE